MKCSRSKSSRTVAFSAVLLAVAATGMAHGADHPIITEVFSNPWGNDGPVGRQASNANQEYLEIYLPTAAALSPTLNKDALRLTFYEVEGDSSNPQRGHVSFRVDLPTFDVDPSNGTTFGAIARPSSGLILVGWVDYVASDPNVGGVVSGLAGTPSTRVALINGGVTTAPAGTVFVAMNGAQFDGTTNFPVPVSESFIDITNEHITGTFRNGSNAYLLMNRDNFGFTSLDDRRDPAGGPSWADLPGGSILGRSALLDALAGNDDPKFNITLQPYSAPTGLNIDLEDVLPAGGVFSMFVPQIPEAVNGGGYVRRFVDSTKTSEDGIPGNQDPALDAESAYVAINKDGPFFATPGSVTFTTATPELSVALASEHMFDVIANTTGGPGLIAANIGGNFPIDVSVTTGASSNPSVAAFSSGTADLGVMGQTPAFPRIAVAVPPGVSDGASASASVTFHSTNSNAGDPAVLNAIQSSTATVTVLNPSTGFDAFGVPLETTVYMAVQGLAADPLVNNEFLPTDLGAFVQTELGSRAVAAFGHAATLLSPTTNLENFAAIGPLEQSFPSSEANFINAPGAPGTFDLVNTVFTSAKVASGSTAYDASFDFTGTKIKAISIPIRETSTTGGSFSPSEPLFFADAIGNVFDPRSGLSYATTNRTFEVALVDTNTTSAGIESGQSDDFGIVVRVGQVIPGASVVPGQLVFLSYTGGLQGEDIDSVDVPGINATNLILLDLDNLHDVLGADTISEMFLIDSGVGGTLNVIEAFSLNPSVQSPLISPIPNDISVCGSAYSGPTPTLTSPATMLPVTWSLVTGPSGMTIDSATGIVSWPTTTLGAHLIRIRATNSAGFDNEPWTLTVNPSVPTITGQPGDQTACEGDPVTFSVIANGVTPLSYQWRVNGSNIAGAVNPSYSIPAATIGDAGSYDVIVSSPCGSTSSIAATLTVNAPSTITTQPQSQSVAAGVTVSLTVSASGTAPLAYQWRLDGVNLADGPAAGGGTISGAAAATLVITQAAAADQGTYDVVVSNTCGAVTSAGATLTVSTPCPGDLDGDLDVDLTDLAVMLTNFGTSSGALPSDGDLDGDGDVDLADLALQLSNFGNVCQ